ncbi:hypothetical protein [Burkholderia sp. TSV86]|uniref:hypothetical protein n=1 Tax=Burkholderia sp. TSV86 TaxID=1385594 RepID=UPI0012E3719B|nr:hypothetical protein [Burkholderia sp. TSV86]
MKQPTTAMGKAAPPVYAAAIAHAFETIPIDQTIAVTRKIRIPTIYKIPARLDRAFSDIYLLKNSDNSKIRQ